MRRERIAVVRRVLAFSTPVLLLCLAGCGGGGSGSSGGGQSSSNPVPAIVALNPTSVTAGASAFTLTITGQNFLSSSTLQWNGSDRAATFSSSTQLQVQIASADVASSGSVAVSVTNPTPGGGNSGSAEFEINSTSNPSPALQTISPSTVSAGTSNFVLTLTGSNFIPNSTIQWNGSTVPTTYLSETQLEAQVPEADLAQAGYANVTVVNPAPGGGTSAPAVVSVAYAPLVVAQGANDMVWDASSQRIYLSVPSLAASNGNTITALDPTTGQIGASQFAGSEPDRLAISDDDQYLYAGVDGSSSVERFTLPGLVPDINYSLGAYNYDGPTFAFDLQVAPGLAHTTAVSRGDLKAYSANAGMAIFDDAVERSTLAHPAGSIYDSLQWGSDAMIYANNSEITNFDFYVLNVSSTGVVQSADYLNEFSDFYVDIHYDNGTQLVYTDDGYVINPSNGQQVGNFQAAGLMVPDSTLNSAFFFGQTADQFGTTNFTIEEFNLTTLVPVAETVVPGVQGDPLHLIRWGTNGLAFNDNAGYVYILSSPFVTADGTQVVTPQQYLRPVVKMRSGPNRFRSSWAATNARGKRNSKIKGQSSSSVTPNPNPVVASLNPSSVEAGLKGFTLTVSGSNFVSLSTIEWNGSQVPTEFISSSELQAQIGASDVAAAGSASVNVVTPSPGGGSSRILPLTIFSASGNPAPVIVSLYPDFAVAGSAGFTLNVNGLAYFNASSIVLWNGSPRSSTLYTSGQLQIQINASDLVTPGYGLITVVNPGPGGGTSSAEFQILYQPTIVNQATNDLVWDSVNQVIYISVPSSASAHANQICILNPSTAAISNCQNAGNEPDVLAISDNSQYLYVGEDGTGAVQRFILPALTPDISYSLGNYESGVPYFALDLQVAPGAPHTTAVTLGAPDIDPITQGGITIFDDSTPRPISAPGWSPAGNSFDSIQWGSDTTELYSADSEGALDFYTLTVSSSGVVLDDDYHGVLWNPGRIHYDGGTGLVYSDDGYHAVNPATGLPAGLFESGGGWPMVPDSSLNTAFLINRYVWQENSNYTFNLFDMTHYTPVNRVPFATTSPAGQDTLNQATKLIRWGSNGLAVIDMNGHLFLISASFVSAADSKPRSKTLVKQIRQR